MPPTPDKKKITQAFLWVLVFWVWHVSSAFLAFAAVDFLAAALAAALDHRGSAY
jgi:hypothetical protein